MRGFVVVQLLLQVGNIQSSLGALTGESLVDRINRDVDEPGSSEWLAVILSPRAIEARIALLYRNDAIRQARSKPPHFPYAFVDRRF